MKVNSKNADGVFEPFDTAVVPVETFHKGTRFGMSFQHLSSFGGGDQVSLSLEILEPGRQANPFHYHMLEEEHVFVLEGELTLRLGEREYLMTANHYVCFPAGQKVGHAIINNSATPCRYLVLGTPCKEDVAVFPETGRVDVKLLKQGFSRQTMAYLEGIDIDDADQSPT